MIEFLEGNAVWIIVVAIVFVMALIGYLSENSELGKKVLNSKKKNKTKKPKEEVKPKSIEEAKEQINNNAGLASAVYGAGKEEITSNPEVINEINNDAWSTNVDTNKENPVDVVEGNTDDWLNMPSDNVSNEEEKQNTMESNNIDEQDGALFNLPDAMPNYTMPEVNVETIPEDSFSSVEILDIDDKTDFSNVEILTTDDSETNSEANEETNLWEYDAPVTAGDSDFVNNDELNASLEGREKVKQEEMVENSVASEENVLEPMTAETKTEDGTLEDNPVENILSEITENNVSNEATISDESNDSVAVTNENQEDNADSIWK